jgi:hypothetical protein
MRDIYAKNLDEIERLYRTAESKVEDADARARLKMIGDNLTVLHWNLRQFRLLDDPKTSSFYLSDADFFNFLSNNRGSLALQPTASTATPSYIRRKLNVAPAVEKLSGAEPAGPFRLRGDQHLVLCPTSKQPVQVKFRRISARGKLVTYVVYRSDGTQVSSGLMSAEVPVELAVEGCPYYHMAISAGSASFMVQVTGAAWAVDGNLDDQGLHFLGTETAVYFHVPQTAAAFHMSLEAKPPGETAVATLCAPDGQVVTEFDCTSVSVDRQEIAAPAGSAGWWKLQIKRASTGALDDVWVKAGDELSGYSSLVPAQALQVEAAD